jgi:hypothetical protein
MIRGAALRGVISRKLSIEGNNGDYHMDDTRSSLLIKPVVTESMYVKEGDTTHLTTSVGFKLVNRVGLLKINPVLHDYGLIQGQTIVDESDGLYYPSFRFEADVDTDLTKVPWFCKLYISGDA